MRSRSVLAISASALLATSTVLVPASASTAAPARTAVTPTASKLSGSFAISGRSAAAYVVPDDVTQVWTSRRPDGATQTRYQQRVAGADVFGGQVTVLKNAAGRTAAVAGAHYPGLHATSA